MARQVIMGANIHIEGISIIQKLETCSIPVPKVKTEEFNGVGMGAVEEIALGKVEVMMASFTIVGIDKFIQKQLAVLPNAKTAFTIRGYAMDDEGNETPIVATLRGLLKAGDAAEIGEGLTKTSYEISCKYFKYEQDGEKIHEISTDGTVMMVGGKDHQPNRAAMLGI